MPYFTEQELHKYLGSNLTKQFVKIHGTERDKAFYKIMKPCVTDYESHNLNKYPIREVLAHTFKSWANMTYKSAYNYRNVIETVFQVMNDEELYYAPPLSLGIYYTASDAAIILNAIRQGHKVLSFAKPVNFSKNPPSIDRLEELAITAEENQLYTPDIRDLEDIYFSLSIYIDDYLDNSQEMEITYNEQKAFEKNEPLKELLMKEPSSLLKTDALEWLSHYYNTAAHESANDAVSFMLTFVEKIVPSCGHFVECLQECVNAQIENNDSFEQLKNIPVTSLAFNFANNMVLVPLASGEREPLSQNKFPEKIADELSCMGINAEKHILDYIVKMTTSYTKVVANDIMKQPGMLARLHQSAKGLLLASEGSVTMKNENLALMKYSLEEFEHEKMIDKLKDYKWRQRKQKEIDLLKKTVPYSHKSKGNNRITGGKFQNNKRNKQRGT
ncbi:MAG: hypothetical protein FWG80_00250 [Alphaproteobacteria bacterium]|nr:hypothetical protein [Alphaproteobacteria bacterium]